MTPKATSANPEYDWAKYLHCMEGTPEAESLPVSKPTVISPIPGLVLCLVLTIVSYWAAYLKVWPFLINGHPTFEPGDGWNYFGHVGLGIACRFQSSFNRASNFRLKNCCPWASFCSGRGWTSIKSSDLAVVGVAMSCLEVVLALILMIFLTRWLKLSGKLGTLLGIGTAICGGTAIVAAAPVIEAEEADVVFGVATVTLLGLIAMFLLPVLGHLAGAVRQGVWYLGGIRRFINCRRWWPPDLPTARKPGSRPPS